jgi:1-acyl-sn-glycerol-3-phosphate acyltransferase
MAHPGAHAGPVLRAIGRAYLAAFGWTVSPGTPNAAKAIFVAAPHTSNWDLPFTLAICWALDMKVNWLGKTSLFRAPFGGIMRALGGIPIDRTKRLSQVESVAESIAAREKIFLIIAPAGTRSKRDHWKSGFYRIAEAANVPMIFGFLDYAKKTGGLGPVFIPTGNVRADMDRIREFYANVTGKFPEQASIPRLLEEDAAESAAARPAES